MSSKTLIARAALVLTAAVFTFSAIVQAKPGCSSAEKAEGCEVKTASAECCKADACSNECSSKSKSAKIPEVDAKVLKTLFAAAESGDFSKVEACKVTRAALKTVTTAFVDFQPECKEKVLAAASGETCFSGVSACESTRAQIKQALASYALYVKGADTYHLNELEQAAVSGDFSKVSACPSARGALRSVLKSSSNVNEEVRTKLLAAVESGDFTGVSKCSVTRDGLKQALCDFKENTIQTALKE